MPSNGGRGGRADIYFPLAMTKERWGKKDPQGGEEGDSVKFEIGQRAGDMSPVVNQINRKAPREVPRDRKKTNEWCSLNLALQSEFDELSFI